MNECRQIPRSALWAGKLETLESQRFGSSLKASKLKTQEELRFQFKSRNRKISLTWERICLLFYLGFQLIGWDPPTWGRTVCFPQSTGLNVSNTQKHPHRNAWNNVYQISGYHGSAKWTQTITEGKCSTLLGSLFTGFVSPSLGFRVFGFQWLAFVPLFKELLGTTVTTLHIWSREAANTESRGSHGNYLPYGSPGWWLTNWWCRNMEAQGPYFQLGLYSFSYCVLLGF